MWGVPELRDCVLPLAVSLLLCVGCGQPLLHGSHYGPAACDGPFPRFHPVPTQPVFPSSSTAYDPPMQGVQPLRSAPPADNALLEPTRDSKAPSHAVGGQPKQEVIQKPAAPVSDSKSERSPWNRPEPPPPPPLPESSSSWSWIFRPAIVSHVEPTTESPRQAHASKDEVVR